ncbi:MAG: DNA translocase FtsK [Clostridia bacterium]|nr:DNA translocase FtsK [Clostridia bacterium]
MAKSKKTYSTKDKAAGQKPAGQKNVKKEGGSASGSPQVRVSTRSANYKEISAIILLTICAFIFICLIDKAGFVGHNLIRPVLFGLFGVFGSALILVTIIVFSITILRGTRAAVFNWKTVLIVSFFILFVATLLHTLSPVYETYLAGHSRITVEALWTSCDISVFGGGLVAGAISTLLRVAVGKAGALVLLIPITLIFTLLLFRFSLLPFFTALGKILVKIGKGIGDIFSRLFGKKDNGQSHKPIRVVKTPEINTPRSEPKAYNNEFSVSESEADGSFKIYAPDGSDGSKPPVKRVIFDEANLAVDVDEKNRQRKTISAASVVFDDVDDVSSPDTEAAPAPAKKEPEEASKPAAAEMISEPAKTEVPKAKPAKKPAKASSDEDDDFSFDEESFLEDPVNIYNSIEPGNLPVMSTGEYDNYKSPPLDLLTYDEEKKHAAIQLIKNQNEARLERLRGLFESRNIAVNCEKCYIGPSFSQFIVVPKAEQEVKGIKRLAEDISVIVSGEDVRIEAPIPGENAIGVEMVNKSTFNVYEREIFASKEFKNLDTEDLPVGIGLDIRGNTLCSTMKDMIHIMIGGTTGSGKSVFTRGLILSLVYRASPDQVRLILVDPKKIEFPVYKNLPHLLTPVIYDCEKATSALGWVAYEMDKRYNFLQRFELNGISEYNSMARKNGLPTMPRIVVVIDEFADLVSKTKESKALFYATRIASLARACGIHLVLATQRPSAEIFTGILKANMPSKVCLLVHDNINSRIILGSGGGEKLNGHGDMLCLLNGDKRISRLQNGFCDGEAIKEIVAYIKAKNKQPEKASTENELSDKALSGVPDGAEQLTFDGMEKPEDEKYMQILEYVIAHDEISVSEIQRVFRIGYNNAANYFDRLMEDGYVENSKAVGSKKRRVLKREID